MAPLALVQSALSLAFAVVVIGGRHSHILQVVSFWNVIVAGEGTYYRAQSTVCQAAVELTTESCRKWRENSARGLVITMDGSWRQRRNASHFVIAFINVVSGRIVYLEIIEKLIGSSDGNHFHYVHGMEVEGVRGIDDRWCEDQKLNTKIMAYVRDCDGKTRKLHAGLWLWKQELLDSDHIVKSFDRRLNNNQKLNWIKEKLRRWFTFLIHMDVLTQEKAAHWRNTILHH
jgi:hypothetical protein